MRNNKSKYKLVVDYAIDEINEGRLKKGAWMPFLSEFREIYGLSHDTVFSGIRESKSRDIIRSSPRVRYYIISAHVSFRHDIFLLFNEFNESKEDIYNSFMETVGNSVTVDPYFHNYNRKVFETLVNNANHKYTTYIIMSGKFADIDPLLENLSGNVSLLDHYHSELKGKYSPVFQDFKKDTYETLAYGPPNLRKYKHVVVVQKDSKEPFEHYDGLQAFYKGHGSMHGCTGEIQGGGIIKREVFVVVNDRDLVNLLKQADRQQLVPGEDFGIMSYSDTPLKEVLAGGVATLSTDFKLMGRTIASFINKETIETTENPWSLNIRNSL